MENKKYIIYIDESGISSKTGYSVYVCLYVEFNDYLYLSQKIIDIEKELKISYTHWTEMPWKFRLKLVDKVKILDFKVKAVFCENPTIPDILFESVLRSILNYNHDIVKIFIDGKKSKFYKKYLKKVLRDCGLSVSNIKTVNDKNEPLIRLADFMAGLIRSNLDDVNNLKVLNIIKLLKSKIIELYKAK